MIEGSASWKIHFLIALFLFVNFIKELKQGMGELNISSDYSPRQSIYSLQSK